MIQQTLIHASCYKILIPDKNFPEEPVFSTFQVMSNEILDPRILHCPFDTKHSIFPIAPGPRFIGSLATNFSGDLKNHVSYFIGLDASTNSPRAFLCGDDNFEIGDAPVKSGLLELSTKTSVAWTSARHTTDSRYFSTSYGNVGFADGSVHRVNRAELRRAIQQTGLATNRLAIP
jgi:prepilin-type processing-associated H-X9-DG protein